MTINKLYLFLVISLLGVINTALAEEKTPFEIELEETNKYITTTPWKIDQKKHNLANFEKLSQLNKSHYDGIFFIPKKAGPELEQKHFVKTIPYQALLKENSTVYDVTREKHYRIPRDIHVMTQINTINADTVEILDKNGQVRFRTNFKNISIIEDDLDINTKPGTFTTYTRKDRSPLYDKKFELLTAISIHRESVGKEYFEEFFRTTFSKSEGRRMELKLLYKSMLGISPGLNLGLGTGTVSNNEIQTEYKSYYIGPSIEYHKFKIADISITPGISLQKSIGFQTKTEWGSYSFKQNLIQLSLEAGLPIRTGEITAGIAYRIIKTVFEDELEQGKSTPIMSSSGYKTVGLSIGYRFGFIP